MKMDQHKKRCNEQIALASALQRMDARQIPQKGHG
jgi:hypothetical protein